VETSSGGNNNESVNNSSSSSSTNGTSSTTTPNTAKDSHLTVSSLLTLSNISSQQEPHLLSLNSEPKSVTSSIDGLPKSSQSTGSSKSSSPPAPFLATPSQSQKDHYFAGKQEVVAWFKDENYFRRRNLWKPGKGTPSMFPLSSGTSPLPASSPSGVPSTLPASNPIDIQMSSSSNSNPAFPAGDPHDQVATPVSSQVVIPMENGANNNHTKRRPIKNSSLDTESDSDYGDDVLSDSSTSSMTPQSLPLARHGDTDDPRLNEALNQIDTLKMKLKNLRIKYKNLQEQQSKGKREIRNANACEAHKRRHQKCPDNCPGRVSSPPGTPTAPPKKRGKANSPLMPGLGGRGQLQQA